jgi:virginiamycin B lyase
MLAVAWGLFQQGGAQASSAPPIFYELPAATHAYYLAAGLEGTVWFTGQRAATEATTRAGILGRVDADGEVTVEDIPGPREPGPIAAGSDGSVWFATGYGDVRIRRRSPDGAVAEWNLGNGGGEVRSMAAARGGGIWFTEAYVAKRQRKVAVGQISNGGVLKRFPLPPNSYPNGIAAGPDGSAWFTETRAGGPQIGRITPNGRLTHHRFPARGYPPDLIVAGADGNLWFSGQTTSYRSSGDRLGRISPGGGITEFRAFGGGVAALAPRPGGGVWFSTSLTRGPMGVGAVASGGASKPPRCLDPTSCQLDADALATGADGSLWFAASKYYSHMGGGGSGMTESGLEEGEAGLIGRFLPGAAP